MRDFEEFENMDRLIAEADFWLANRRRKAAAQWVWDQHLMDLHADRIMDDFLDGAEAYQRGEDVPQSFDYMLDEFGCIDDMAVFAARGNVVGGMVVA